MERAWRDVFPFLLRTCCFEADFRTAEAKVLSNLVSGSDRQYPIDWQRGGL